MRGTAVAAELLQSEFNHKQEETRAKTVWIFSFTKTSTTNRELRQTNEDVPQQWIIRQKRRGGREGNRNRARRQKLLLLSSKDYENCVKAHKRRKSCTQKKKTKRKKWKSRSEHRRQKQNHTNESKREAKTRANEGERGARGREAKREQRESARARGERETRGSLVPANWRTGRTKQTNERTNGWVFGTEFPTRLWTRVM